jgi:RNA polymerase sigma-70 factor, ECF subfamily
MATWVRAGEVFTADASRNPASLERSSETADDDLVRAAQKGDRTSFGVLYEKYARMVHGLLLSKIPAHEVDDLTQDVFMKAMGRLSTLRERSRFGAWLAAIARNAASDYYRRSLSEEALQKDEENDPADPRSAAGFDDAGRVLEIIRSLPEAYRETLILRLVEGMTGPEIAERTGMTAGSVRVNLHRGMEQLREKLRPQPRRQPGGEAL